MAALLVFFPPPSAFRGLMGVLRACTGTKSPYPIKTDGLCLHTLEDACANRSQHRVPHRHCLPCTGCIENVAKEYADLNDVRV